MVEQRAIAQGPAVPAIVRAGHIATDQHGDREIVITEAPAVELGEVLGGLIAQLVMLGVNGVQARMGNSPISGRGGSVSVAPAPLVVR